MTLTLSEIMMLIEPDRPTGRSAESTRLAHRLLEDGSTLSSAERDFLREVASHSPPPVEAVLHPRQEAGLLPAGGSTPLEPSDIAWIERLPTDPTKVPYLDAVHLATMAANIAPNSQHGADARLIRSVWAPVAAVYDQRQAEAELRNAQAPARPIPTGAVTVLAEAYRQEGVASDEERADVYARKVLSEVAAEREQRRRRAIGQAEERNQQMLTTVAFYAANARARQGRP